MFLRHWAALACAALTPCAALAQDRHTPPEINAAAPRVAALVLPGSGADELRRTRQLTGRDSTHGTLIRSTGSLTSTHPDDSTTGPTARALLPVAQYTYNSIIPFSLNDGSMWAGRDSSIRISGGGALHLGPLSAVIAPELAYSQNRSAVIVHANDQSRSPFSSPWFTAPFSADLPLRFGAQSLTMVTPGSSRIELRGGAVSVGATTEDQWWGPGIRNALVLSNNAPGIPHLFLRTARPLRSPVGSIEARWINGVLTESIYFDRDSLNDVRSLSAIVATLRFAAEPGLTVGVARAVYAAVADAGSALQHVADALLRWDQVGNDSLPNAHGASEQILSVFGRWVLPADGVEIYGELARQQPPRSDRELLVAPHASQAFIVGMQVARPLSTGTIRGSLEFTMLEQTPNAPGAVKSFYSSSVIPQGYTQRGQTVGAAIGPGSSSQSLAVDFLGRQWTAGMGVERIRWQEDAYPQQLSGVARFAHDVSLIASLRAGTTLQGVEVRGELLRANRLNYLFQSRFDGLVPDRTFDVGNTTLRLSIGFVPTS